jgi:hypothetical protein
MFHVRRAPTLAGRLMNQAVLAGHRLCAELEADVCPTPTVPRAVGTRFVPEPVSWASQHVPSTPGRFRVVGSSASPLLSSPLLSSSFISVPPLFYRAVL